MFVLLPNWLRFSALVVLALAVTGRASGEPKAPAPAGWKLVWSDEFDGPEIDKTKWDFDRGNGFKSADSNEWISGWGNGELEFYTNRPQNAFIKDGQLHLRAMKESYKGYSYTSARMNTRNKAGGPIFNQRYGRFEFRAKLPIGQGVWPAIWMRPQEEKYGVWPASGEIDILEAKGQAPNTVQGTLHFGSRWPANTFIKREYVLPDKGRIDQFHVYALEWEPGEIRWYVDDKLYSTQNFWWSCSDQEGGRGLPPADESELNPWPAPFDHPFYIIMNVAIGGQFLGNPDRTTLLPAEMVVDYVRVYERTRGYGATKPRGPGKLPFAKP
jgi:beta-glucanase (GH16 family)